METAMIGFAYPANRRACTQERASVDHVRLDEAAALARSAVCRQSNVVGQVIMVDRGERRQLFLPSVSASQIQ